MNGNGDQSSQAFEPAPGAGEEPTQKYPAAES